MNPDIEKEMSRVTSSGRGPQPVLTRDEEDVRLVTWAKRQGMAEALRWVKLDASTYTTEGGLVYIVSADALDAKLAELEARDGS